MSRGFGASGSGASDAVRTNITSSGSDWRSYSIWVYRTGNGGGGFGNIFFKNFSELFWWTGSVYNYSKCNAAGVQTARHNCGLGTTSGLANVWLNLVLTHDQASGALTPPVVYYNGVFNNTQIGTSASVTAPNTTDPYYVGNDQFNTRVWDGLLAHFAIWDDTILGFREVQALASGASPMDIAPAKLVSYLPLDGIHNPEFDHIIANRPSSVTGTRLGTDQPPLAPMYIGRRSPLLEPAFTQAQASAAARQLAVTIT